MRTLATFFYSIYCYLKRHRTVFFITVPLIFVLLAYWASRIRFEEDITKLIPTSEGSSYINEVLQSTKFADKMVINISTLHHDDVAVLQEYADAFASAMEVKAAQYIQHFQVRLEDDQLTELMDVVNRNLPLFLDDSDYRRIDSLLLPDTIASAVRNAYRIITAPQHMITMSLLRQDPLGLTYIGLQKFQRLQSGESITLEDGYLITEGRKNLLAFITTTTGPGETARNTAFIELLDHTIQELNTEFDGRASAEYFGAAAMAVANAQQIKQDIRVTLSIALIVLIALFIYFYRRAAIPLIILFPAAFGSLLGMAVLYWVKGTISAISIGIGSVLLGLTLDYSLHILSHYRGTGDIKRLFESTTKPLLMCAIFTAVDFLCLLFLHSDVLKDLGIFAAVSVMGAAVFALVFIPQVYSPHKGITIRQNTFIDAIARYDLSRNNWFLGACLLLTIVSLFTFQRVTFNDDLSTLNYQPGHLKQAEQRLDSLTNYAAKSIYLVAYGNTYDEALARNATLFRQLEQAEAQHAILGFQSVGNIAFSTADQQQKIDRWNRFWTDGKKEDLIARLRSEGATVGFKESTFQPFFDTLTHPFSPLDTADRNLLNTLFLDEFIASGNQLTAVTTIVKVENSDAEPLVQSLTSEELGVLAIDRKHLQEKLLSNLEADFDKLFLIASIAVFVVIFAFFGSIELTLVTNVPIFLGWLATLGLMGVFGVQFNAFNIIITTLIFGLGVDYSIFVTQGLLEQYTYGSRDMPAYKSGVVMSALATMLCFGILIFAKHPAIRSISIIPLIGLLVVVLMSFSIQPWLFRRLISAPQEKGNTPWRIGNLMLTGLTFGYFFLGGMVVSLLARLLMAIVPVSKKKKLNAFHRVLQLFFHHLMYSTPGIRMHVIGRDPTTYHAPAIIVANHTSILDTPTMGLLNPAQIFMMNDRQLRSPFFGRAMRMVGSLPATDNHPERLEELREKVKQGYSIIVFPEGTRSTTSTIHRFHKGAFYLADQLKLDILPVLIHGNAHILPKNDNMLKPGSITMKFLPRIKFDDISFGATYSERTKKVAAYFKQEFRALCNASEPASYFEQKIRFNYLYKPKVIQREVATVFNTNKERYHQLLRVLPLAGRFLHLGCGYGVLDFLLVYDSAERHVTAWDTNPEKISAAQHTYTVNRYALRFVMDISPDTSCDVLILSGKIAVDQHTGSTFPDWVVLDGAAPSLWAPLLGLGFRRLVDEPGLVVFKRH